MTAADETAGEGLYLVDKAAGPSSFAVVRQIRRLLNIQKVGHAGTLDPFASGLLLICAGRAATRHIEAFMTGDKRYEARLQLGVETTTQDPEGEVTSVCEVKGLDMAVIEACLPGFLGESMQQPPAFSALKYQGKPLYSYARAGIAIAKPARPVRIYELQALFYDAAQHTLDIAVRCSRGTYIRVLAEDIGRALGVGAHLRALRRTGCGPFSVQDALASTLLLAREHEARETARSALMARRIEIEAALARVTAQ